MEKLKVLIDEETLNNRIKEMAKQISNEYKNEEIILVCILKGAVYFMVDLSKFEIENKFVVGYGLDYADRYRNLPYVGYIE